MAPYPFTTMTPNLGVMQATQQDAENFAEELQKAVLADLPGLIQGAHQVERPQFGAQRPCLAAQACLHLPLGMCQTFCECALLPSGGGISLQHGITQLLQLNAL